MKISYYQFLREVEDKTALANAEVNKAINNGEFEADKKIADDVDDLVTEGGAQATPNGDKRFNPYTNEYVEKAGRSVSQEEVDAEFDSDMQKKRDHMKSLEGMMTSKSVLAQRAEMRAHLDDIANNPATVDKLKANIRKKLWTRKARAAAASLKQPLEEASGRADYAELNKLILAGLHSGYPDQNPHEAVQTALGVSKGNYDLLYKPLVERWHGYLLGRARACVHLTSRDEITGEMRAFRGPRLVGSHWVDFKNLCDQAGVPNRYPIEKTPEVADTGPLGGVAQWKGRAAAKRKISE